MKPRSLENYKEMFKNVDKEKIIEINYELSKKLCELEEALQVINKFIHLEDYPKVEKLEQNASYDEILTHIPRIY